MAKLRKTLLYYDVSEKIKDYILSENIPVGGYLPSERKLAEKFNVAFITLRKSLECLLAEGIIKKVPRKGSQIIALPRPKQQDSTKKRIGVTIWLEAGTNHPGTLNTLAILGHEFNPTDYEIVILYITSDMIRNHDWTSLLNNDLDGLFISVQEIPDTILQQLQKQSKPLVIVNRNTFSPGAYYKEEAGIQKLINYLASLGHQRIAFITGKAGLANAKQQVTAFEKCCISVSIQGNIIKGTYDELSGYQKTLNLLNKQNPPSALLLGDDFMALGALKALKEKGLTCPDDISIACFGGSMIAQYLTPTITALKVDNVFKASAKMLRQILESESPYSGEELSFERELILRESTGPAKI